MTILPQEAAANIIANARSRNEKVVFTNGCFDMLHKGHKYLIKTAEQEGDFLIVGLNSDISVRQLKGKGRPVQSQSERAKALLKLDLVDFVIIFEEETPFELIKMIQPDLIVKGGDYKADEIVGSDLVKQWGGRVMIVPLLQGFSTTKIVKENIVDETMT